MNPALIKMLVSGLGLDVNKIEAMIEKLPHLAEKFMSEIENVNSRLDAIETELKRINKDDA